MSPKTASEMTLAIRELRGALKSMTESNDGLAKEVRSRLDRNDRGRNFAYLVAGVCLVAAIGGVVFGIVSRSALDNQADANDTLTESNRIVICALGQASADAYRTPLPAERPGHFIRRMKTQRKVLVLSGELDCGRGFETRRLAALAQLEQILDITSGTESPGDLRRRIQKVTGQDGNEVTLPSGGLPSPNAPASADRPSTTDPPADSSTPPADKDPDGPNVSNPPAPIDPDPSPPEPSTPGPPAPAEPAAPRPLVELPPVVKDPVCGLTRPLVNLC